MAQDKKISELESLPLALTGTEDMVVVQNGVTYKLNPAQVLDYVESNNVDFTGNLSQDAGKTITLKAGSGQRAGNATLVAGSVIVNNATISAFSVVILCRKTIGGVPGNLTYTLSAGSGFTITSSSASDTSTVSYLIVEVK